MATTNPIIYGIHPPSIRQALELYLQPSQVTELRALNCKVQGEYRTGTYSGYFDAEHIDELIYACQQIEFASGVYFVPNPVNPDLLARRLYKAEIVGNKEPLTSDKDIISRRWLLIDCDPIRPAGISASDAEKHHAREMIVDIDHELWSRGFPPGIIADSGNGWHLSIPINLPVDDGGTVEKLLKRLAKQFDNEHCKVDVSVFNPARIWKLPGTMSCKGSNAKEIGRPWRMAKIVTICEGV